MTAKKKEEPEAAPNPNMELWNRLCRTNPDNTKKVEYGTRKFTAIAAHSQVMTATEAWGPCGGQWGFSWEWIPEPDLWLATVTLRYPAKIDGLTDRMECQVSQVGAAKRKDKKGVVDDDAPKKAITDGLTKCFSYTGMNADVFLGKFDDNKYVQKMREEQGINPNAAPITTGREFLPPKVPHDPRATGRDRMKYLSGMLCGDKDPREYFTGLAADLGIPMATDDMNFSQFSTILAELEAMEEARVKVTAAAKTTFLDGVPMGAYNDGDDIPF